MNKLKKYPKLLILSGILAIFMIHIIACDLSADAFALTESQSEILIEQSTDRVLFSENEDIKLPMASTTKILTALVVLDNCSLDESVTVPKEAVGVEGSSIYLREDEVISVEALLYGLMLRSGNDAAVALAIHVSGSVENFCDLLNKKAKEVGACNSSFLNPHGLTCKGHYTTAKDLALITAAALNNETFRKIVSTKSVTFGERVFVNKNKMLYNYDGADGVKTGYTVNAGRCLVTSATRDGMQLISVVLNCPEMYERSKALLDKGFSEFELVKVVEEGSLLGKIPVCGGFLQDEHYPVFADRDMYYPLTKEEQKDLRVCFEQVDNLSFPINKGQFIGKLSVFSGKDLLFSSKLFTISSVNNYRFEEIFKGIIARFSIYED